MSLFRNAWSIGIALTLGCAALLMLPEIAEAARGHVRRTTHRTTHHRATHTTVHRTAHRSSRRIYVLPSGYRTVVRSGTTYYYVGDVYYQAVFIDGNVTYVVVKF